MSSDLIHYCQNLTVYYATTVRYNIKVSCYLGQQKITVKYISGLCRIS